MADSLTKCSVDTIPTTSYKVTMLLYSHISRMILSTRAGLLHLTFLLKESAKTAENFGMPPILKWHQSDHSNPIMSTNT